MSNNWWEPTEKEKIKKKIFIWWIVLIVGMILTAFLFINVNNSKLNYKKVKVVVVDVNKDFTDHGVRYYVKVNYRGEVKDLNNVINGYSFYKGRFVEVYESKGKLYADMSGVRSNTNIAYLYFFSLFVTLVLFMMTIIMTRIYILKLKNISN